MREAFFQRAVGLMLLAYIAVILTIMLFEGGT